MSDEDWIEAVCFFKKANKRLFGAKLREVSEAIVLGGDSYPLSMDQAYRILTESQQRMDTGRAANERNGPRESTNTAVVAGASNFQRRTIPEGEAIVMGTDRRVYNVQCNNCNGDGK